MTAQPEWRTGQRVSCKGSDEVGTVAKVNGDIKVNWDTGQTS